MEEAPVNTPIDRAELARLGSAGASRRFLPLALTHLQATPDDHEIRALVAVNLARLGLRTLALEHLAALSGPGADELTATLRPQIESLPPDATEPDITQHDLDPIDAFVRPHAGHAIDDASNTARTALESGRWFTPNDSASPVIVAADAVLGLSPASAASQSLPDLPADENVPPMPSVVIGCNPACIAWAADRLRVRAERAGEIFVLDRVTPDLLIDLARAHAADPVGTADVLGAPQVHWCFGSDPIASLEATLRPRLDLGLPTELIVHADAYDLARRVGPLLRTLASDQHKLVRELTDDVVAAERAMTLPDRLERFAGSSPLRVLLPTTRYSTYVQHAAQDLALAFRELGHEATVLAEPEPGSRLTKAGYARAMHDLRPDLVVTINYLMDQLGRDVVPPEVPSVCWVQDAMPHFFSDAAARARPREFAVGHIHDTLTDAMGFPPERCVSAEVPASEAKFNAPPLAPDVPFACELLMATRHSETPEAFTARHAAQAGSPNAEQAIHAIAERLRTRMDEIDGFMWGAAARTAVAEGLADAFGTTPDDEQTTLLVRCFAEPFADLIFRQQTAAWAAAVAKRRGWRFHLHGTGWADHPTLAPYDAGELEHGTPLADAYRTAAVTIHASARGRSHQRVSEAALAGGLPVCRRRGSDLAGLTRSVIATLHDRGPDSVNRKGTVWEWVIADHPEAAALVRALQVTSARTPPWLVQDGLLRYPRTLAENIHASGTAVPATEFNPWETSFASEAELEALVERAVDRRAWRTGWSAALAQRASTQQSSRVLAQRMLDFVRTGLEAERQAAETTPPSALAV